MSVLTKSEIAEIFIKIIESRFTAGEEWPIEVDKIELTDPKYNRQN